MIITCPECLTKFRLEEDRVPEEGIKARCSRCQHVFPVQKPATAEESFYSEGETPAEFAGAGGSAEALPRRPFPWKWAAALLAVLVVGGGVYWGGSRAMQGVSAMGRYLSEKTAPLKGLSLNIPFLKKYLGIGEGSEGFLSPEKVKGYYLENIHLNRVFVIEGEAVNHWKESRSFIKVKGVLLDSKGSKVQEKEVYCGNILSEKDLKEMSKAAMEKSLASQFGISFSNVNILPGKSVPFMIVFTDLPAEKTPGKSGPDPAGKAEEAHSRLSDFTVEVSGSQKGSK